jgi:hypothetical protein
MTLYTVQIIFQGDWTPLLVTTDKELAEKEIEQVNKNYLSNSADKPIIDIFEREAEDDTTVFYNYDWYCEDI